MAKTLTFVDSGVLITAIRGHDPIMRTRALGVLNDPQCEFASSSFVKLEVIPKAIWSGNQPERTFYKSFFASVHHWPTNINDVIAQAEIEASAVGLNGMDALHIAAAVILGADELVTIEKTVKSIHRTQSIKVVSIQ